MTQPVWTTSKQTLTESILTKAQQEYGLELDEEEDFVYLSHKDTVVRILPSRGAKVEHIREAAEDYMDEQAREHSQERVIRKLAANMDGCAKMGGSMWYSIIETLVHQRVHGYRLAVVDDNAPLLTDDGREQALAESLIEDGWVKEVQ